MIIEADRLSMRDGKETGCREMRLSLRVVLRREGYELKSHDSHDSKVYGCVGPSEGVEAKYRMRGRRKATMCTDGKTVVSLVVKFEICECARIGCRCCAGFQESVHVSGNTRRDQG